MNEITAITPQIKDKRRCNVYVDGRFCCGMLLETAVKNRLKVGQIITPDKLSLLQLESEKNTALDKALTHLSASRKTEKQIRDFLSKKGYLTDVCDYVVQKLKGYDFLNDEEYGKAYVDFTQKKKGEKLIRMELRQKGLSQEAVDNALSNLNPQTQEETAKNILQKYLRGKAFTKENLMKAFRYLCGKGFDYDTVKSVLNDFKDLDEGQME